MTKSNKFTQAIPSLTLIAIVWLLLVEKLPVSHARIRSSGHQNQNDEVIGWQDSTLPQNNNFDSSHREVIFRGHRGPEALGVEDTHKGKYGSTFRGESVRLDRSDPLTITTDDSVYKYNAHGDESPVVIEKFKLIFFTQRRVASKTFKKLFRRMMGYEDWKTGEIVDVTKNGLTYLYNFTTEEAAEMIMSPEWTKAIFVRDPKLRALSAYLEKVIPDNGMFIRKQCCVNFGRCVETASSSFEGFLQVMSVCESPYWNPQSWRMDARFWPYINFVGHVETASKDGMILLKRIGAWDEFGASGWGKDGDEMIFPDGFESNAWQQRSEYFEDEMVESLAEAVYADDYGNPFLDYDLSVDEFLENTEDTLDEGEGEGESDFVTKKSSCGAKERGAIPPEAPKSVTVDKGDYAYKKGPWDAAPVVIEDKKLMFFTFQGMASTDLKKLFRRMMGLEDWKESNSDVPHNPKKNGLTYLWHYSVEEAADMLVSKDWVRAVIVRDPKERALAAYLNIVESGEASWIKNSPCLDHELESFENFLEISRNCCSPHWMPQTWRMESRYWPLVTFVVHFDNMGVDMRSLLEKVGAWNDYGETGWGENGDESFVDPFLSKNIAVGKEVMAKYYSKETEALVEDMYREDYENELLGLEITQVMDGEKGDSGGSLRFLAKEDESIKSSSVASPSSSSFSSDEDERGFVRGWIRKLVGKERFEQMVKKHDRSLSSEYKYGVETPNTGHFGRTTDEPVATERSDDLVINKDDCVYSKRNWDGAPVVLEQSKLIFFTQRRVASKTFKRLFRRIIGFEDWKTADVDDPKTNGLKYLYDYSIEEAETMMMSDEWTRAIFVRDPKERVLSAFLDLALSNDGDFIRTRCCDEEGVCVQLARSSFSMFLNVISVCENPHWNPQTWRMEGRYWAYIDFVGHLENAPEDGKKLLQQIGVWDEYGATGWGQFGNDPIFPFGYEAAASKHRSEYYIAEMDLVVEDRYKEDYDNPFLGYERAPSDDPEPENAEEEGETEEEKEEEEEEEKEEEEEEEKDNFGVETPHTGEYGRTTYEPVALERSDPLIINKDDCIYRKGHWDEPPVVVEKFRLIFFAQPRVGAGTFKRLLRRMMGFEDWKTGDPFDPSKNGLTFLYDYSIDEAQEMMMSEEWTKAVFVRDPKQRAIEAYLTKATPNRGEMIRSICCQKEGKCAVLASSSFEGFLKVASVCQNSHWIPQSWRMEGRYWAYMDVVGHIETAADDIQLLLERIGAWKEFGSDGWGKNGDEAIFESGGDVRDVSSMLDTFYSSHIHEMAEMIYAEDYNNPYMRYSTDGSIEEFIGSTEDNLDDENLGVEVVADCGAVLDPDTELDVKPDTLVIDEDDYIYKKGRWDAAPVVVEEFKLVFFTIPQIAASTFKQLFRRMMGFSDWHESNGDIPHNPKKNGLKYLYDYSPEEAVDILESDEWTKAIFARDPKERALATYLTVTKGDGKVVREACCKETGACVDRAMSSFKGFLEIAEKCCSPKWMPQTHRMKSQVWPFVNFVGDIEHASRDIMVLLDKVGAWDEFGSDGWGKNGDESIFESASGGDIAKAKMAMGEYYTEETEDMVERMFVDDYANPYLPYEPTYAMTQGDAGDEGRRLFTEGEA